MRRFSAVLPLLLASLPAVAAQDVTLSGLDSYEGQSYTNYTEIGATWVQVARDLGTGIANKPQGGSTLGLDGFEIGASGAVVFVNGNRYQGGPTAWERAREGNQSGGGLFLPGVTVRKGLPFSLEVGGTLSWIASSRQGAAGGYGRFAPLEGYRKAPEIALQLGYSGYVGNEELDLGVTDASLNIGKTVAFGARSRANTSTIQPYGAFGMNWIKANPRLTADRLEELQLTALTASKKDPATFSKDMRQIVLSAGVRIVSGDIGMRVGASVPLGSVPTVDGSIGYAF
ncbi:MAG: hypothetical protein H6742_06895 [Alphaproteobacteria bacterium]|nr:hypothetical protein [Alphaproteobacteria bacterium]